MHAAVQHVEALSGQIVNYLRDLVRIPTVNPPGYHAQIHGRTPALAISPGFNDTHSMLREVGIPALTYGPGTTGTAHTPDEYSVIEDLTRTTQVLVQVTLPLLS